MSRRARSIPWLFLTWLGISLLAPLPVASAPSAEPPHGGVEAVRVGGKLMYKYRDETGQIVFQDRPPPQYFAVGPADAENTEATQTTVEEPVAARSPEITGEGQTPWYLPAALWLAALALAGGGLWVLLQPLLERLRSESSLDRGLRQAGLPAFVDLQAHSGPRDRAVVDRLVRTPAGLLVLGIQHFTGTVTGSAEQKEWQQTTADGVTAVDNPLLRVRYAEQLVRTLVGEVPVHGRVVCTGSARLAGAMPPQVQKLSVFKESLAHFSTGEVETRLLDGAWRTLMRFPRANKTELKIMGSGWQGWLRRHWRTTTGAALLGLSAIVAIVALVVR